MKRIMRKLIVCVAAGIMMLAFTAAPVFASSPIADNATVSGLPDGVTATVTNIFTPEAAASAAAVIGITSEQRIAGLFNIDLGGVQIADGNYVITFVVAGLTDPVAVYHFTNGVWTALPTTYVNNVVTATTPSFSDFAIVARMGGGGGGGGNTNAAVSPKTDGGVDGFSALLIVMLIIRTPGAVYAGRRAIKAEK
jgi:hypothetical protein